MSRGLAFPSPWVSAATIPERVAAAASGIMVTPTTVAVIRVFSDPADPATGDGRHQVPYQHQRHGRQNVEDHLVVAVAGPADDPCPACPAPWPRARRSPSGRRSRAGTAAGSGAGCPPRPSGARVAPRARRAPGGSLSAFSTTSAVSLPRIPVLWIANASTSGQAVGPSRPSSRKAHTYSGTARRKTSSARVRPTSARQAATAAGGRRRAAPGQERPRGARSCGRPAG